MRQLDPGHLTKTIKKAEKIIAKEGAPAVNVKKITGVLEAIAAQMNEYVAFRNPAYRMMTVMLVSFLEAYLEDGLIEIAVKNPKVIENPAIEPNRLLEIESIDQLRAEIRLNWAQASLRPGGPVTWVKRLRVLGAAEIKGTTLSKMQHLWDTRNLIIHSRSIASNAYARTHTALGFVAGKEVVVASPLFEGWLIGLKDFLFWTETFLLKYGSKR